MRRLLLTFLLCSTWMIGQSKISDNQIRTPPPLQCSDTTTSGTTQTCTTAPSFTPAAKDCVTYNTTTTNTGALTLNVNSQGAKPVQKWLGSALVAGDVVANKPQLACYDGTNWQLSTIGNAPGTGAGTVTSVACGTGLSGGTITTTGTCTLATSAVGSSGMILLEEHTASTSSEIDFTTCISSTYDMYEVRINQALLSGANHLLFQVSTNGGSSYDTTSGHYAWGDLVFASSGSAGAGTDTATGIDVLGRTTNVTTSYNNSENLTLDNPAGAAFKHVYGNGFTVYSVDSNKSEGIVVSGVYLQTTAYTAFRFIPDTGTITSGIFRCYGITK